MCGQAWIDSKNYTGEAKLGGHCGRSSLLTAFPSFEAPVVEEFGAMLARLVTFAQLNREHSAATCAGLSEPGTVPGLGAQVSALMFCSGGGANKREGQVGEL